MEEKINKILNCKQEEINLNKNIEQQIVNYFIKFKVWNTLLIKKN